MCKANEWVTTILAVMDTVKQTYEQNHHDIGQRDMETQDLLHEIELGTLNASQRIKVFNELRQVRQERRRMKLENRTLEPLYRLLERPELNKIKIDLYKAKAAIAKEMEEQKNLEYKPRVRDDLSICRGPEAV